MRFLKVYMDKNPHKKYAEYSVRNNNPDHYIIKTDTLSHVFLQGDPVGVSFHF